jgi:hypothetical protein
VILRERPNIIHSDKIEILQSPATQGLGVFVKLDNIVAPGDAVAQYPGDPVWATDEQLEQEVQQRRNPYVFAIGPLYVSAGRRRARRDRVYLCWDGSILGYDAQINMCGHLLNTSHPLMVYPWCEDNCMFGVYINDLELNLHVAPKAELYIIATRYVTGSAQASSPFAELRLDYHSVLAHEFGYWCLRLSCEQCIHNLVLFVNEHIINRDLL